MDPQDSSLRWHRWTVSGPKETLSQFFDVLDADLPKGWRRVSDKLIVDQSPVREGAGWYALDATAAHAGVTLSIEPRRGTEVRGGRVWFAGPPYATPSMSLSTAWDEVIRLLDAGIVPAARKVGAQVHLPTPEDVFFAELPTEVGNRLRSFAAMSRKTLPLDRSEAESWHAFIVTAFRHTIAIDARLFTGWLVAQGWPTQAATELVLRFFDQCKLLTKFADAVSVA